MSLNPLKEYESPPHEYDLLREMGKYIVGSVPELIDARRGQQVPCAYTGCGV